MLCLMTEFEMHDSVIILIKFVSVMKTYKSTNIVLQ